MFGKERRIRRHDDRLLLKEDYLRRNRRSSVMVLIPLLVFLVPYLVTRLIFCCYNLTSRVPPERFADVLRIIIRVYNWTVPQAHARYIYHAAAFAALVFFILAYESYLKLRHIESIKLYRPDREPAPAEAEVTDDA